MNEEIYKAAEANEVDNTASILRMALDGAVLKPRDPLEDKLNAGRELDHLYPENMHHKVMYAPVTRIEGAA